VNGDFRLRQDSPCLDAGTASGAPSDDIDGNPRPFDIPGRLPDGTGAEYDMGAYEATDYPAIAVETAAWPLDFGPQHWDWGPTAAQSITIASSGFGRLLYTGAGIEIAGDDASQFAFTDPPDTSPQDSGTTRTLQVVFDPSTSGEKQASVSISTNDPANPLIAVPLVGGGGVPPIPLVSIEPASPRTMDDIVCIATPADHYPIAGYQYEWQPGHGEPIVWTESVLPNRLTEKHQGWYLYVRAFDIYGVLSERPGPREVFWFRIENSPPTQPFVEIKPDPVRADQDLIVDIQVYSTDPDGDNIEYDFDWFKSIDEGESWIHKTELNGSSQVSNVYLNEGEWWQIHITPYEVTGAPTRAVSAESETEGIGATGAYGWDQIYIGDNSPPAFQFTSTDALREETGLSLDVSWEVSDGDGDDLDVDIYWTDQLYSGLVTLAEDMTASSDSFSGFAAGMPTNRPVYLHAIVTDAKGAVTQVTSGELLVRTEAKESWSLYR